jgi:hypothetical protein
MRTTVTRLTVSPVGDADWSRAPWCDIPAERLQNYMGERPAHFPVVDVRVAYDETALYVMFRVEDQYVRAVAREDQDSVCVDSCVEFFFTPGPDVSKGYFNLEMNGGGTMLFHYHPDSGKDAIVIPKADCSRIARAHSLPHIVDPEIPDPVTWTVEYGIPIDLLQEYGDVSIPEPGVSWRANFYKCADHTSHPHWLTWAPVDFPRPNFHLPESFGVLEFL